MFHMQFVLDFNKHLIKIDFFSASALANSIYLAASHTAGYQNCKLSRKIFSGKRGERGTETNDKFEFK